MIKINNLNVKSGTSSILRLKDIYIEAGEIISFIGKKGSGKSILAKSITGKFKNYDGSISINGKELKKLSKKNLLLSCLYHNDMDRPADSVLEEFLLKSRSAYKKPFNAYSEHDRQVVYDYASIFKLNDWMDKRLTELSDGTVRLASIASTMIAEPKILALDNPTSGLDPESILLLKRAIQRFSIQGSRIVIISGNDLDFMIHNADKIYLLNNGDVAAVISPNEITSDILNRLFGVDFILSKNIFNGKPEARVVPES
jgi:ABC-type multidrug transport system ATPase subunit